MVSSRSVTVGVSRACGKCQVVVRLETDFVEQSHHTGHCTLVSVHFPYTCVSHVASLNVKNVG